MIFYQIESQYMTNIIVQIGTANSKIGFSGEAHPRIVTESVVVEAQHTKGYHEQEDYLFAHRNHRQLAYNLDLSRKDFVIEDIFDRVWQKQEQREGLVNCSIKSEPYCRFLGELIAEVREGHHSAECNILLVESANSKKYQIPVVREKICQYLFDEHNLNSVYFLKSSVSTALGQGCSNAIVIDSGQNYTNISRVHDGYQQHTNSLNFGGNVISRQIQKIISENGLLNSLSSFQQEDNFVLNDLISLRQYKQIKETLSKEVGEIQNARVVQVELPDKQIISIDKQIIADPLTRVNQFKSKNDLLLPSNYKGIQQLVGDLMEEGLQKFKNSFSKNIVLTGGNFLYQDMRERVENQIRKSASLRGINEVQFIDNKQKLLSGWIGGSLVSSMPTFSPYWVTNKEWKENGSSIIAKKCP